MTSVSVIVWCFGLAFAFMFAVVYDLYQKLHEAERTISALQTTVANGQLIASILNARVDAQPPQTIEPQATKTTNRKRRNKRRRNKAKRNEPQGTSIVCYAVPY